jgi:hypothetical protein
MSDPMDDPVQGRFPIFYTSQGIGGRWYAYTGDGPWGSGVTPDDAWKNCREQTERKFRYER